MRASVAPLNKSRYIPAHAFLTPHLAIAFHLQPAGRAEAARRALILPIPIGFKAGGSIGVEPWKNNCIGVKK